MAHIEGNELEAILKPRKMVPGRRKLLQDRDVQREVLKITEKLWII